MATRFQSGMQGVFHAAAELTHRGFIVSLTARNAFGADLLVTDNECRRSWSVQVKTNKDTSANFWLLNAHSEKLISDTHIYIFVALKRNERPAFLVVPSNIVAMNVWKERAKTGSVWYSFSRDTKWDRKGEGWEESFGNPGPVPEPENPSPAPPSADELENASTQV